MNRSVLICRLCYHIMKIDQHIAIVIHRLCDFVKFVYRCHPLLESGCCTVIAGKPPLRIYNQ